MNPIAVMLVASGQGLMAVISPRANAESQGILLLSHMPVKNSFTGKDIYEFANSSICQFANENHIVTLAYRHIDT